MSPNPQETADLVTFTEEILNGKLHFFVQCNIFLKWDKHILAVIINDYKAVFR